jgi:murein DD-endopeptidase MepM/ murein hydrolase activator NlpD
MSLRRTKILSLSVCAAFLASATSAFALTSGGGGIIVPPSAEVDDVICLSGCTEIRTASPGGEIQITGSNLSSTETVSFAGKSKRVKAEVGFTSDTRVEATVPEGAETGKVRVINSSGSAVSSGDKLNIGPKIDLGRTAGLRITDAETSPTKAYQYGKKRPTLNYVINGGKDRNDLRIDITTASGEIVFSKFKKDVPTGSSQSAGWSGKTTSGKRAPNGKYHFVIRSLDGTEATLSKSLVRTRKSKEKDDPFGFRMYSYVFPLRASHSYGDGIGAGRGHQGQDVLADCGSKLVAARAGTVYYNDYQASGAGNYLVINLRNAGGKSQVYMHMIAPSPLKVGEKVKTGQRIGTVGSTGRSTACHLHFEIWSNPGWYQGGSFLDPTPSLKKWDRYS